MIKRQDNKKRQKEKKKRQKAGILIIKGGLPFVMEQEEHELPAGFT